MDAVEALERLGGTATAPALLALTTRKRLRTAVSQLAIRKAGRNRYVLPAADQARRAATLCGGSRAWDRGLRAGDRPAGVRHDHDDHAVSATGVS